MALRNGTQDYTPEDWLPASESDGPDCAGKWKCVVCNNGPCSMPRADEIMSGGIPSISFKNLVKIMLHLPRGPLWKMQPRVSCGQLCHKHDTLCPCPPLCLLHNTQALFLNPPYPRAPHQLLFPMAQPELWTTPSLGPNIISNHIAKILQLRPEEEQTVAFMTQVSQGLPEQLVVCFSYLAGAIQQIKHEVRTQRQEISQVSTVVQDFKGQMESNFKLNQTMTKTLAAEARALMMEPQLLGCWVNVDVFLQDVVIKKAAELKLPTNLSSRDMAEFLTQMKRICSSQKQASERQIKGTILPTYQTLGEATHTLVKHHSRPGDNHTPTGHEKSIVSLWRYLFHRKDELLAKYKSRREYCIAYGLPVDDMDMDCDDWEEDEDAEEELPPRKRKRSSTTASSKKKGKAKQKSNLNKNPSFWMLADFFVQDRFDDPEWGRELTGPRWDSFIKDVIREDRKMWPSLEPQKTTHFTEAQPPLPSNSPSTSATTTSMVPPSSTAQESLLAGMFGAQVQQMSWSTPEAASGSTPARSMSSSASNQSAFH